MSDNDKSIEYKPVYISSREKQGKYVLRHGRKIAHEFHASIFPDTGIWYVEEDKLPGIFTAFISQDEMYKAFEDERMYAATKVTEVKP